MIDRGVLYSSGMIAGEGIVGIALAILAVIPMGKGNTLASIISLGTPLGNITGAVFFLLLLASMYFFAVRRGKAKEGSN